MYTELQKKSIYIVKYKLAITNTPPRGVGLCTANQTAFSNTYIHT